MSRRPEQMGLWVAKIREMLDFGVFDSISKGRFIKLGVMSQPALTL